jgi:hypothetical protein
MRILFLLLASLLTPLYAKAPAEVPHDGFSDFGQLSEWASTTSFGGGKADCIKLGNTEIFYSDRMFTSGVPTSEVVFYVKTESGRIEPFIFIPVQQTEHHVESDPKSGHILLKSFDPKSNEWRISMTITPWMLPPPWLTLEDISPPLIQKTEQGAAANP